MAVTAPGRADEAHEPGRIGLLDELQEGQVAVLEAGQDEERREPDHEDEQDGDLVERHDDRRCA